MCRGRRFTLPLSVAAIATLAVSSSAQDALGTFGTPRTVAHWEDGQGIPGVGLGGSINAWASFDDGNGPAVYAGGWFRAADDEVVNGIARWDGEEWHPVAGGIGLNFAQEICAMASFDDGNGEKLYVAGQFDEIDGKSANGFARWDGETWQVLPGQVGFGFRTLVVSEDTFGPALFAGGEFISAGGAFSPNIARWKGGWSALGSGLSGRFVNAVAFFDDGSGEALYAGTDFNSGESSLRRWDGTSWTQVAGTPAAAIQSLRVFDNGSGPRLAVGFSFGPTSSVYEWDGFTWTPLGVMTSSTIDDLDVWPNGGNDLLVASGRIVTANGNPMGNITTWNGTDWLGLGTPAGLSSTVPGMAVLDVGNGPSIYVGGAGVATAGSTDIRGAARWDGTSWSKVGSEQYGLDGAVYAFAEYDDGNGNALYASGSIRTSGVEDARGVVRWNGGAWEEVGGGFVLGSGAPFVSDLHTFQTGDGPLLIAVGQFQQAGGNPANSVARWNGVNWASLGTGVLGGQVHAVESFDNLLYIGGTFGFVGGQQALRIAAWDGVAQTWSTVPGELTSVPFTGGTGVYDMLNYDDGTGEALWVVGEIELAGQTLIENIGKWDGTSWSATGFGGVTNLGNTARIDQILAVDHPSFGGKALVIQGRFDTAGSLPVNGVAALTSTGWAAPGDFSRSTINALTVYDAGRGPQLYAEDSVDGLVRWNGTDWIPLGAAPLENRPTTSMLPGSIALHGFDDGTGPALFVGGDFDQVGNRISTNFAKWILGGRKTQAVLRSR